MKIKRVMAFEAVKSHYPPYNILFKALFLTAHFTEDVREI
jgi:hypothetical protein